MIFYGLKTCDTCRKARRWLDAHADYDYRDVRNDGLDRELLGDWFDRTDWQSLVNRRSTTWKSLDPADRDGLNRDSAIDLLIQNPTLLKRPVLDTGDDLLVGFDPQRYADVVG